MNTERLVKLFNQVNGARVQWSSGSVKYTFDTIKEFDESLVEEIIKNCKSDTLQNILNPQFIKKYIEVNQLKDALAVAEADKASEVKKVLAQKEEVERQLIQAKDQSNNQLGAIQDLLNAQREAIEKSMESKIQKALMPEVKLEKGEVTHEAFDTVLKFVMADEPVMLTGPAGTGKNVICKQIAKTMNLPFHFTNAVTQEYKLTGFIDANGNFHETEFYKAFKDGGIFMLDEIDASIPEVLIILNAAIANRYFDFPNGKIEAHPDFRVIAAGNTYGTGASYTYVGRNQLDGASLDRFALINVGYSPKIEESLTGDKKLLTFVRAFRKACDKCDINHIVSYRAITRMEKMRKVLPIDEVLKTCLIKGLEQDDLRMIISEMRRVKDNEWKDGLERCAG